MIRAGDGDRTRTASLEGRSEPRRTLLRVSPVWRVRQDVLVFVSGRLVMAVAFLSTPASMTAEQYDRVIKQLEGSGAGAPPGRRFHACVGQGDHLMVFDVWDSVEEFRPSV